MSDVVIVSGSPGSGKTTVARLLGQQFDRAVHLHTDDFFAAIVAGGVAPFLPQAQEQNQVVVGVTAEAAFGYATGGYTTIVDGVVGPWMIDHYRHRLSRHRLVRLHYVVLRPDRQTALDRAQGRTAPDALVDADPILALWEQFVDLGPYAGHALDTSDLSIADTVAAVGRAVTTSTHRLT